MYEASAVWTIVGPDGTTVILNDGASGLLLEQVTGFDSPNVRQNVADLPEFDGAVAGPSYYGSRPVTLTGRVAASSAAQRNAVIVSLQRALRGLRGDVTLKSQAQGLPPMQATARFDNARFTGGYVKDFQISLICPDPRIYSQALNEVVAAGLAVQAGASFPWAFPVNFGGVSGATLSVAASNAGNFTTMPIARVLGPAVSPQIKNANTGESLFFDAVTLAAGEYLDVDFAARTVVKSDGSNQYASLRFPGSSWFALDPGSTTVELWASGATAQTEIDVWWRDAWA